MSSVSIHGYIGLQFLNFTMIFRKIATKYFKKEEKKNAVQMSSPSNEFNYRYCVPAADCVMFGCYVNICTSVREPFL